jgi:hypothetical protein
MLLAERHTTGITVELHYNRETDSSPLLSLVIRTQDENGEELIRGAHVPNEEALQAFYHPMVYVADPSPFA